MLLCNLKVNGIVDLKMKAPINQESKILIFLANTLNCAIIQIRYGYLKKFKGPSVSDR